MTQTDQRNRPSIGAWREVRPATTTRPAQYAQVFRLTGQEARLLCSHGYAEWRGRKQTAITVRIPQAALLGFVGQMRMKLRPEATALDSRTYQSHGPNPWKQGRHVRSEHYAPDAHHRGSSGPGDE
jgi:hypothetical protein